MHDPHLNASVLDAEEILAGILEWVEIETPTSDPAGVNRLVDVVERLFTQTGARVQRTPGQDGFGDILTARSPWGGEQPGILVLAHLDTVHPLGSKAERNPIRREGDRVFGPGIYDMKAGGYLVYHAFRHLLRGGRSGALPITFLYVPDEEVGSPTSRAAIEAEGRNARYVLVAEPAREGGKVVTGRNGVMRYDVLVNGRPAHAGVRHMDGRSAIKEMARQVLRFEDLTDYARGLTCSVGVIQGGTVVNVVPAECRAEIDIRVPDAATSVEVQAQIAAFRAFDQDCTVTITGDLNRPPYEKSAGVAALFAHARGLAAETGFDLQDLKTGGGSDGNFTAALGVPTLDGLGADGDGAHTYAEFIYLSSLVERTRLMARLFETLA